MNYADVVIDNRTDSTDQPYTYACGELALQPGDKVWVPFARSRKLREGYVLSIRREEDIAEALRHRIRSVDHADDAVSLTPEALRTAVWMRDRYVCRCIDALRLFTPPAKAGRRKAAGGEGGTAVHRERKEEATSEAPAAAADLADAPAAVCGAPMKAVLPGPATEEDVPAPDLLPANAEKDGAPTWQRQLTQEQSKALEQISRAIRGGRHERFLLYGVTGSGKTEVYLRAVSQTLAQGKTAIVLVPEISLTSQIVERFAEVFGEAQIAVMHSKLTLKQRGEQWQRIRRGQVRIVIGARSAVFAPVTSLGLIVIDEEHEATYKSDFTPKYDTAEVALKRLADRDNRGVLLLGSATPSVASYSRAREGIYRILPMRRRYNEVQLPRVTVADMRRELREGNRSMLSRALTEEMQAQLDAGRQVMLLQNRRGYSTFVSCRECGHVAVCPSCGLSLTYHREGDKLACHYCGHERPVPEGCPECGSRYIRYFGSGTEKVEETVQERFPASVTDRIDLDSVKARGELNRRLKAFGKGKTDILIGTQMIAKGLDFRNVGLVGIISADLSLNIPDYRSPERAFQLITQAAGRAGRGDLQGSVVIQTYDPDHYAIRFAAAQDYDGFFAEELAFRKLMCYPPFSDMIQVLFTSRDEAAARDGARSWYGRLQDRLQAAERGNVLQPQPAYMGRIRDVYRYSLVIRCPRGRRRAYTGLLRALKEEDVRGRTKYTAVVDINPYSFA